MATITLPNTFSANTTILSAAVNSNFSTIFNDYNGNVTNANVASGAAIARTKLGDPIATRVNHGASINIPNGSAQFLSFNTENYDTDTMHSTTTNPTRITATTAGYYIIGGGWIMSGNATGMRVIAIRLNGTTEIASHRETNVSTENSQLNIVTKYQLAAGDYVEISAYQNSGTTLFVSTGTQTPNFWAGRM